MFGEIQLRRESVSGRDGIPIGDLEVPDRIANNSLEGNKLKNGSVGSDQIGAGSIRGWHMPADEINHDLLQGNCIGIDNLIKDDGSLPEGWCKDPVLKSVPNNVYGGYAKKVGYLFDPSLGVPPDNMCGWTYTTPQGEKVFKSILKQGSTQEWQQKIPYDQGSGVGYVLDPDCFFKNDIHGNHLTRNQSYSQRPCLILHNSATVRGEVRK